MKKETKSQAEIAVAETAAEIDRDAELRKRMQALQYTESERKRREQKNSRDGQETILKEGREKISGINRSAEDQKWMSASWTDRHGNMRHRSGSAIMALDPDVALLPDLLIEDNFSSVQAILDACSKAMDEIKKLFHTLRENSAAMPPDLETHINEIIAGIPPLSSIRSKITCPEEPTDEPKPAMAGGGDA